MAPFKCSGGEDPPVSPKVSSKVTSKVSSRVTSKVSPKVTSKVSPKGTSKVSSKRGSKKLPSVKSAENPVKGFMIRWSLCEAVSTYFFDHRRFRRLIEEYADRYIFQIEFTFSDEDEKVSLLSSCDTSEVSSEVPPMVPGNYHYQCYVHTKLRVRPSQLMHQLRSELVGVEVQPAANPSALMSYCMKEETRFVGPFSDKMTNVYDGSDLISEESLYSWQKVVQFFSMAVPDNTSIICIYDPVGGSGKSAFAKFLCYHYSLLCIGYADCKDLLFIVSEFSNLLTYLVDLTRSRPTHVGSSDLYAVLEQIKNGQFISTKYKPKKILMYSPNLIIFSNFLPNIYSVSPHRWRFYGINGDKNLVAMSTSSAQRFSKVQSLCLERDMGNYVCDPDGSMPKKYQDLPLKFSRYYLKELSQLPCVVVKTSGSDRILTSKAPSHVYYTVQKGVPLSKEEDSYLPLEEISISYPYYPETFLLIIDEDDYLLRSWQLLTYVFQKNYRRKDTRKETSPVSSPVSEETSPVSSPVPEETSPVSSPVPDDTSLVSSPVPEETSPVSSPVSEDTSSVSTPAEITFLVFPPAGEETLGVSAPAGEETLGVSAPVKEETLSVSKEEDSLRGLFLLDYTPLRLVLVVLLTFELFFQHLSCFCFISNRYTGLSMKKNLNVESLMLLIEPQFIVSDFSVSLWE